LLSDLLAALLNLKEDVVGIAVLFLPCIVQTLEPDSVLLLQTLQGVHQFVIGLAAGEFQSDLVGVEIFLAKDSKVVETLEAQECGLKAAIHGLQGFIGVEFSGAELPIA
jgi:hypothetical protein